jgi:glycosyltransferase involved in cell wall biosynthesis
MQRICTSLSNNGYEVELVGVLRKSSTEITHQNFKQKRIKIWFDQSFLFYAEYNIKLLFYLLLNRFDAVCAIDLDTIMPVYFASLMKQKKRVYDAHEIFTQMKEVLTNKPVYNFWMWVEKTFVPKFKYGYTVNNFIQQEFKRRYNSKYEIVRNIAIYLPVNKDERKFNFIIYQGAVNHGRAFEQLIPAMKLLENVELKIYGKGNFYSQTKALIKENGVDNNVKLMGSFLPKELKNITPNALCGITIFEPDGMNQYYSLANRFFDYMMAGIPQICVNYPEYKIINDEYNFALMIDDVKSETIVNAIEKLLADKMLYQTLQCNAIAAREKLNWQNEEAKLINYWRTIV